MSTARKNPGTRTVAVTVKPGLERDAAVRAAFNKARREHGKNDARAVSYDPRTGKAKVT